MDTFVTSSVGVTSNTNTLGQKWSFTYSTSGFLESSTDPRNYQTTYTRSAAGNPLSKTHPDGAVETWTRDSLDLPLTYTLSGPGLATRTTTWTRDASHRVTRIDYPDQSYETFAYNGFGQVTSHRMRNGGVENTVYNGRGLNTRHTDPLGNVTTYAYDANDRLASVTDANLHTTSYQYNERGLLTQVAHPDQSTRPFTYDSYGNRLSETDELGHTTAWAYDEFRRLKTVTDPLNRVTHYDYALPGQSCGCDRSDNHPTSITLPSGKKTVMTYDSEWKMTSKTTGYGTVDTATTGYFYDSSGNVISITDPKGNTWSQMYDSRNRRISATDPLSNTTQWTYDAAGNVLTVARADGGVTTNTYDEMDRLLTDTNPKNETTQYGYDEADNFISLIDARNNAYHFEYDLLKRRTRVIYPDSSHEDYNYDGVGNLTLYTARNGVTCTRVFDNRNRETSSDWSDSTPDVIKTYDAAGRLFTAGNSFSTSTYAYDNANQLIAEIQTPAGLGTSFTVGYTYDADGNCATLTYPNGMVVNYAYTNRNEVASIVANGPPPLVTYGYDANGNRTLKSLENGTSVAYVYDDASRLISMQHTKGALTLAKFDYTLNSVGNRASKAAVGTGIANRTETYAYDAADQAIQAIYSSARTVNYAYDPVGNRTSVTDNGLTTPYTINNLNQYTAVDSLPPPAYDVNGNLTAFKGWTYVHDAQNRLVSASSASASATFAYDARNRQVRRTINGVDTYFVWDDWKLIAEHDAAGNTSRTYVHGAQIDEILAKIESDGTAFYHHQDGLGSVIAITDSSGAIVESYHYDIFGTPSFLDASRNAISETSVSNRFLFTGREWIADVGLYDYRNRVYSSELGRFIQTDPIGFNGKDVNLYKYVANDPIAQIDPLGLEIQCTPYIGAGGYMLGPGATFNIELSRTPWAFDHVDASELAVRIGYRPFPNWMRRWVPWTWRIPIVIAGHNVYAEYRSTVTYARWQEELWVAKYARLCWDTECPEHTWDSTYEGPETRYRLLEKYQRLEWDTRFLGWVPF
ncbi:MAG TPA: RHS repeat-associated core domain-containing protein [Chthoniobacterales bacterium]